jgi:hypothetical protein
MYEYDHMLNGRGSRQHQQDIIRCVQQERLARQIEAAQGKGKFISPAHAIFIALINLLTK